jgi:hypothetical protein
MRNSLRRFGPGAMRKASGNFTVQLMANNRRLFSGVVSAALRITGIASASRPWRAKFILTRAYEGNPLVNAFCLGVLRHDQIARGAAKGIGNPVFYVGPATGRDGLAGAAFASQDLTRGIRGSAARRGAGGRSVHGKAGLRSVPGIAGDRPWPASRTWARLGLTCSTCETAARAGHGHRNRTGQGPATRAEHDARTRSC